MHHSDGRCLADDGRNCALQTCTFSNKHLQQQVSIELQCCREEEEEEEEEGIVVMEVEMREQRC